VRRLVFYLFAATVALSPLPLGANRDWSWSPLAVIVGLLLAAWSTLLFVKPDVERRPLVSFRALAVPLVLFGLTVGWGLLQISDWTPFSWASSISAEQALGLPRTNHAVAFAREQLLTGLMRLLTYAGVFLLAASLSASATDARRILSGIVIVATLCTFYSMAADVINQQTRFTGLTLWTPHPPFFTGAFINGNTYATYAGVASLTALVLAFRPPRSEDRRESAAQMWRRRIGDLSGKSGFWCAAALVLGMGVLLSSSRAGSISLVAGFMTLVALYGQGVRRVVFVALVPLVAVAAAILLPGGETLVSRTSVLIAQGESGREALFPVTVDAIGLRPFLGWGMNSFESLFSVFEPVSLSDFYDKAHNTYLELAFDFGIPVAVMLVGAVLWLCLRCLVGYFTRGRDRELAGLGVFTGVLVGVHSLFDFSLQIPAMACTFFAILGVGWAQSWSSQRERR
jgi:O-antigen ligase